jgi:nucleotide-binding universal stress UspA family protein
MFTKILVPLDGSNTSHKAADYALGLASLSHATVILLTVIDEGSFVGKPSVPASETRTQVAEPLEDYLKGAAEMDMQQIEALGKSKSIATKKVIRYGHAVDEIVKEAETSGADLIVMGSHGRSALQATLLGSVTFGVIHHDTKVPVLVVRK